MANQLDHNPLVIDTTATGIKCQRIAGLSFDTGDGTGTASIVDGTTGKILWTSHIDVPYADVNLMVATPSAGVPLIDVAITGTATLMIYKGAGPR